MKLDATNQEPHLRFWFQNQGVGFGSNFLFVSPGLQAWEKGTLRADQALRPCAAAEKA